MHSFKVQRRFKAVKKYKPFTNATLSVSFKTAFLEGENVFSPRLTEFGRIGFNDL